MKDTRPGKPGDPAPVQTDPPRPWIPFILVALWIGLAVGWLAGISFIARMTGGYEWIQHMRLGGLVGMLALMATLCVAAGLAMLLVRRLPKTLAIAVAIVAGIHLANAFGNEIFSRNYDGSRAIAIPFRLLSLFLPTSTRFVGMPSGNMAVLILPGATFLVWFASLALGQRMKPGTSDQRDPASRVEQPMSNFNDKKMSSAFLGLTFLLAALFPMYGLVSEFLFKIFSGSLVPGFNFMFIVLSYLPAAVVAFWFLRTSRLGERVSAPLPGSRLMLAGVVLIVATQLGPMFIESRASSTLAGLYPLVLWPARMLLVIGVVKMLLGAAPSRPRGQRPQVATASKGRSTLTSAAQGSANTTVTSTASRSLS